MNHSILNSEVESKIAPQRKINNKRSKIEIKASVLKNKKPEK